MTGAAFGLTDWLRHPRADRGVHLAERDGSWRFHPYTELASAARRTAEMLKQRDVQPGDAVAIVLPSGPEFVGAFYGCLLLGANPMSLASRAAFETADGFVDRIRDVATLTDAALLVSTNRALGRARDNQSNEASNEVGGCAVVTVPAAGHPEYDIAREDHASAFIQFSSGSSGTPRGLRIPRRAVEANVVSFFRWLRVDADSDALATWLPLHHDMGLVGGLIAPVTYQSDIHMMEPDAFVRRPAAWLDMMGNGRATISITAGFAMSYLLRTLQPEDLSGTDLSRLRALVIGAERIDDRVLDEWLRVLSPHGFAARALVPAYGLAEATLAVTGSAVDESVRTQRLDPLSLQPGSAVTEVTEHATGSVVSVVSCGRPVPGVDVAIVDVHGKALPPRTVGEVQVCGASVADGYLVAGPDGTTVLDGFDGVFRTGDAGYLDEGELFVLGRIGDAIKTLGRWLFAEDVEDVASNVTGSDLRPVVLLGTRAGEDTAVVLVTDPDPTRARAVGRELAGTYSTVRVHVVAVRNDQITRTTSGKPRRRLLWASLVTDELLAAAVWNSSGAEPTPGAAR